MLLEVRWSLIRLFLLLILPSLHSQFVAANPRLISCSRSFDSQFHHWRSAWLSVSNENPKNNTPFFAIGISRSLESDFLNKMTFYFKHIVYNIVASGSRWSELVKKGIPINFETMDEMDRLHDEDMVDIPIRLNRRSPTTKNILVTLDGINFNFRYSPTTMELLNLFSDENLVSHTRWFKNSRELDFDEIYDFYLQLRNAFPGQI